jgi:CheY-like chemotaxis protein
MTAEPINSKPLNVLLVEDDDGDALAIRRAFRKAKVANDISRAVDGVEALEILRGKNDRQSLSRPYILLVDINMPRMNGIDFVRAVRADPSLRRAVVFVLTTSKRDEDRLAAYDLNVAGYILKETAGEDFLKLITLLEVYWRVVEAP